MKKKWTWSQMLLAAAAVALLASGGTLFAAVNQLREALPNAQIECMSSGASGTKAREELFGYLREKGVRHR